MPTPMESRSLKAPPTLAVIIIGSGFGGLGMGVALRKQGIEDFVILERAAEVGGVWRDNSYPGAACDVPSHLYSFSFEPNPNWSRAFSPQAEIHAYLKHCAQKYDLLRHVRFNAEVAGARFDESRAVWTVSLSNGQELCATVLITAVGQLSRPSIPRLPGMEDFKGRSFHSATWDHRVSLEGRRVAVIGTGASAIQFVPAIADRVQQLNVFQRSPAYILPRQNRAYRDWEKALFKAAPWVMKLHRALVYIGYESRALGFTRFKFLLDLAGGIPFRRMLKQQVPDAALRAKLTPQYQIGCKRVLLSSEYLSTMVKPKVKLITEGIRRITPEGIETQDGQQHAADVIVYGTGFAATEFLAPMRIQGRGGLDLNTVWRNGAQAYLGLTVPGFPNFFMLYGPNTNLGHNSIVYMLESQIAHVMRCLNAMRTLRANSVEVQEPRYTRYNARIQEHLNTTVWNGCKSWYVDAAGHSSTNWPGFTLSYRWLTKHSSLDAYRFTRKDPASGAQLPGAPAQVALIAEPQSMLERANAAFLRGFLRVAFRPLIGPRLGVAAQRRLVNLLSLSMPGSLGARRERQGLDGVPVEVVRPRHVAAGDAPGAILYLHGGAFCLGSPATHRSVTTHLATASGMPVWVPDYRLAPEHPYPAALDDALSAYRGLLQQGLRPEQIVVAGDSAGGSLALALALRLRDSAQALPAALLLLSPVTDGRLSGETIATQADADPMITRGWLEQGLSWYACPSGTAEHQPLTTDLSGLPPMLIQVGDQEVLLSDSTRLAQRASACKVPCQLEIYTGRWHVFQLQSFYLRSAVDALQTLAAFAREQVQAHASASPTVGVPEVALAGK